MNVSRHLLSFEQTGFFSTIVTDYLQEHPALQPFYRHRVNAEGFRKAIEKRKSFPTNRSLLVEALQQQYRDLTLSEQQQLHLTKLADSDTFTITTAHQPNLFTGYLYFVYKILHTVQLASTLQKEMPEYHFVPIYYMGSEDADLQELNHVSIDGKRYEWDTQQTGAVGRMKVDAQLIQLIHEMGGQLLIHPFGAELIDLLKTCYQEGSTIEQATFQLVHALFAEYGVLVLLPDNPVLKKAFVPLMERELLEGFSNRVVTETVSRFPTQYKVQAAGRAHNLFYLFNNIRERLEFSGSEWTVVNTDIRFSSEELINELHAFPERFSPNVILRPVFQCSILPDIAFIGGGGELAYWLELADVFESAGVPYPLLVLRNSFLFIPAKMEQLIRQSGLSYEELFRSEDDLFVSMVKNSSEHPLSLMTEMEAAQQLYSSIRVKALKVDATLEQHVSALLHRLEDQLIALEKKMLRAEKRRHAASLRQLQKWKQGLFPSGQLQERFDNVLWYYARWGRDFIETIARSSPAYSQQFVVLVQKSNP